MNYSSAVLCLYLLFTPLHDWPVDFTDKLKEIKQVDGTSQYKKEDLIEYLNGNENFDAFVADFDDIDAIDKVPVIYYADGNNRLKYVQGGEEFFSIKSGANGRRFLSTINSDVVKRRVYNENNDLVEILEWKNGSSVKDSVLIKKTEYGYDNQMISYMRETFFENKVMIETFYDQDRGSVTKFNYYTDSSGEKILKEKYLKVYDEKKRLILDEYMTMIELADPKRRGQKVLAEDKKKYEYVYTEKSESPDLYYYENDEIKRISTYIDNDTYEETSFFENDYSIKAIFTHGKKSEEIVYINNVETRRRIYEN